MAIIQSILVGKGKGKIGNVVLSGLKGQTVAKQLNSSPSNPRTVAQTDNRIKMANAVLAWQFLSLFLANAKGMRKSLESVYNAFFRSVQQAMPTVLESSRLTAALFALLSGKLIGNWFSVTITDMSVRKINVGWETSGVSWLASYRICALSVNIDSQEQRIVDVALSESDFNAGGTVLDVPELIGANFSAVYIYDSASQKITNVHAFEL